MPPDGIFDEASIADAINDAVTNVEPDEFSIGWFNQKYAVVGEAGKAIIYQLTYDPIRKRKVLTRITFEDLKKFYQNRLITVSTPNGSITKSAAEWWLKSPSRREYLDGVVFDPTGEAPTTYWNLWSGFSVEPKAGDWGLMRDHILNVICRGNDEHFNYLLNWIARMFQFPNRPGEVAIVLRGKKGAGKGILFVWLIKAWGQHGLHIANAKHLVGNFNSHLRDCVALFADEAFFANDKQHEGVLKSLITEPTLPIEAKHQNLVDVINMLHVMLASNADWVIPASLDERRYLMLDVLDEKIGDRKYFAAIAAQMEDGGLAAMIWDMLNRDISDFEVRDIPSTDALLDQKIRSLDSLDRWWLDVLDRGFVWKSRHGVAHFAEWTDNGFYSTDLLHASYLQWCATNRIGYAASREALGARMTKMYQASRASGREIIGETETTTKHDNPVVRKNRPTGYTVDTLENARKQFEAILKMVCSRWADP
jgi:hypothetical protein